MDEPPIVTGAVLVGAEDRQGRASFSATNPATWQALSPRIQEADQCDVDDACDLAAAAFAAFSETSPTDRAKFLEAVAAEIASLGDALIDRAMAETGLPRARLDGERARTVGQLQFHARCVREG